jgi:NAD-dependent SIR2 family protein deacetylase
MSFRKNVFVFGAGFSADAGAPVMREFFTQARNLRDDPNSGLNKEDKEIFDRVISYRFGLNQALAKVFVDLDNIEKLFGFLEMDLQLLSSTDQRLKHDMPYFIARTLEAAMTKQLSLQDCVVRNVESAGRRWDCRFAKNCYAFFLGMVSGLWNPQKRNSDSSIDSVITFNYDLVVEREMPDLGIAPEYGLGVGCSAEFPNAALRLTLLKMHGSSNWLMCSHCKDRIYIRSPQKAKVWLIANEMCPRCNQVSMVPYIIPPTWNKGIEGGFVRPVWERALQELMTAGRLFIVGYSFPETDQFFEYMLGLALSTNKALTEIYVVNSSEKVQAKFKEFFNPLFHSRTVHYRPVSAFDLIFSLQTLTGQTFEEKYLGAMFTR